MGYLLPADADFRAHQSLMTLKSRRRERKRMAIGVKIGLPSEVLCITTRNFPYSKQRARTVTGAALYPTLLSISRYGEGPTRDP